MAGAQDAGIAFQNPPYTHKCLLVVPYKEIGQEIAQIFQSIPNVSPEVVKQMDDAMIKLDNNFLDIERWADFFYKHCICDCGGGGS